MKKMKNPFSPISKNTNSTKIISMNPLPSLTSKNLKKSTKWKNSLSDPESLRWWNLSNPVLTLKPLTPCKCSKRWRLKRKKSMKELPIILKTFSVVFSSSLKPSKKTSSKVTWLFSLESTIQSSIISINLNLDNLTNFSQFSRNTNLKNNTSKMLFYS